MTRRKGNAPALIAVLDACVLFPAALRDTLLRAAEAGLYQARWSAEILEEVRRNLVERGLSEEQGARLVAVIAGAFPEANVTRYQHLIPSMPNDAKDRHVLAAAVAGQATIVVTSNLRHFPAKLLAPLQIVPQSPDDFLLDLFARAPDSVAAVITDQAADLRKPPRTPDDVLDMLTKTVPHFAQRMRHYLAE